MLTEYLICLSHDKIVSITLQQRIMLQQNIPSINDEYSNRCRLENDPQSKQWSTTCQKEIGEVLQLFSITEKLLH